LESGQFPSKGIDLGQDLLEINWDRRVSGDVGHCRSFRASNRESRGMAKRQNRRINLTSVVLHPTRVF
jgi:hypothetical protein